MYNIKHIGIKVTDIEKSIKFYTEIFNCEVIKKYEKWDMKFVFLKFQDTNSTIELIQDPNYVKKETGMIEHIAFEIINMEKEIERLKKMNIKILTEEPLDFDSGKILFFEGPDGEMLEFYEE